MLYKDDLRSSSDVFIGTFLSEISSPAIPVIMAKAGFDFLIIDMEHGAYTYESACLLAGSARRTGITPIIRIPEISRTNVLRALEVGAKGIMAPFIHAQDEVSRLYDLCQYWPEGHRGISFGTAHTEYQTPEALTYMKKANEEGIILVQIETQEALENLDEILSSGKIDIAFVGPYDLSVCLGVPGKVNSQLVRTTIKRILKAAKEHDVVPGIFAMSSEVGKEWIKDGFRFVACSSELFILSSASKRIASELRPDFELSQATNRSQKE